MPDPNQSNNDPGASGSDPAKSTPSTITPKLEFKDGKYYLDGKSYVLEADLIASKKSLEGQIKQAESVHEEAINKANLDLSAAQRDVASLNARIKELEAGGTTNPATSEELTQLKQELETAKGSMESLKATAGKALEYRRAYIAKIYNVPEDTIKDKDATQLDAFEEALKAVASSRGGAGSYAVGGGTGSPAPMTPEERARKVLDSTPIRGVRNLQT